MKNRGLMGFLIIIVFSFLIIGCKNNSTDDDGSDGGNNLLDSGTGYIRSKSEPYRDADNVVGTGIINEGKLNLSIGTPSNLQIINKSFFWDWGKG